MPKGKLSPEGEVIAAYGAAMVAAFQVLINCLEESDAEVTSLSNWANDRSTLSVSRPIEVVVLNCWITETNDTP